ncbi:TSUP family transporter [Microbispora bryophytorum]|uniref:TSUP family transporter n=1 Tax=Microbispora bryophytorum TaxID=1460882 RepID=UPI0033D5A0B7
MDHDVALLLIAGVAVFTGAVVQGGVGFGLGLVAAPLITLLDPSVMPGAVQVVNMAMPLFTLAREWRRAEWRGAGWALLGRLPGSAIGALVVVYVSTATLGVLVGVMVLVAVVLTARAVSVPRNGATLTAAGFGGPPIALVYQSARGPQIRATLALFFCVSAAQSLVILAVLDRLPGRALAAGAALVPFVVLGFAVSGPLRRYLDGGRVRTAVLAVAAVSACALLGQSLAH